VLAFVRLGVLTTAKLRRNRPTGYVVMFIIAVLLPTVDPVSLVFETIPMLILYEGSIWLAVLFERRWQRSSDAELATG
jgi:sec-independent protein translocase protein TatC